MAYTRAAGAIDKALKRALDHHRVGRFAEAEALYLEIVAADPAHADATHLLGLVALQRGDPVRAIALIERADELAPSNPVFLANLGDAYQKLDCPERARECCEQALELKPDFPAARINLGNALASLGHRDAAEECFRTVLAADPSLDLARLNLGLLRLLRGDYATGLPLYEARLGRANSGIGDTGRLLAKLRAVPRWRGESLQGKRVLVWTEQGLGDSVMMMRYLKPLKERGADVLTVLCEAALARMMGGVPEVDAVFSDTAGKDWRRRFDFHVPMLSLPLAFDTRLETIPAPVPYLAVPDDLRSKWARKVEPLQAPRVGLAWAGGKKTATDARRSIALASFAPLLKQRGISFVSLQKGPEASQLASARSGITDWMDDCDDLLETAALISQLDLVISVDTVIAHVAGALGKPVWLLNRKESEWRWMLDRADSPWYPTMRIFRQQHAGWSEVIQALGTAIESELAPHRKGGPGGWLGNLFRRG